MNPIDHYKLGELDAKHCIPLREQQKFDDTTAQQRYQRGLDENQRFYLVFSMPVTGQQIQHGPFWWNTACREQTSLVDAGVGDIRIFPADELEVR